MWQMILLVFRMSFGDLLFSMQIRDIQSTSQTQTRLVSSLDAWWKKTLDWTGMFLQGCWFHLSLGVWTTFFGFRIFWISLPLQVRSTICGGLFICCSNAWCKLLIEGNVRGLDVGCGANCIYPLLGATALGWEFVGVDIVEEAVSSARRNAERNESIANLISVRKIQEVT